MRTQGKNKPPEARESASDRVAIDSRFESDGSRA